MTNDKIKQIISENGAEIIEEDEFKKNQYLISLDNPTSDKTLETVNRLSSLPEVEFAEPNFLSELEKASLPQQVLHFQEQWHLDNTGQGNGLAGEDVNALEAWNLCPGGDPHVVIAVVDDGVDINHPSLKPNIWLCSLALSLVHRRIEC